MRQVETMDVVCGFLPVDMQTAGNTGDTVCMKNWQHCTIIFTKAIGTAGDDPTVTVMQCTDVASGTNKALNFVELFTKQGTQTTTGTWTRVTQTAANTYTNATLAESPAIIRIEFDADDLDVTNGYDCIYATVADVGGNPQLGCLHYYLSQPRYGQATTPSAIVD